jgi:hypothetical protein
MFNPGEGDTWKDSGIRSVLMSNAKSYDLSSEVMLTKQGSETDSEHIERIHSLFQHRQNQAINKLFDVLRKQRPVQSPTIPPSPSYDMYFNMSVAIAAVREQFQNWHNNRLFMAYLENVSTVMTRQPVLAVSIPRYVLTSPCEKNSLSDNPRHFQFAQHLRRRPAQYG